jgi:hypothetical protein
MDIPHFCAASSTDMYSIYTSFAQYYITLRATYQPQLGIKNQPITFAHHYHHIFKNVMVIASHEKAMISKREYYHVLQQSLRLYQCRVHQDSIAY